MEKRIIVTLDLTNMQSLPIVTEGNNTYTDDFVLLICEQQVVIHCVDFLEVLATHMALAARNVMYKRLIGTITDFMEPVNTREARFAGFDENNRPVFKHKESKTYYCLINQLFWANDTLTQEEVDLAVAKEGVHIKGKRFEGEPSHRVEGVRLVV